MGLDEAGTMPEELNPPELLDGFGGWYEEFWELSTERSLGMAIGPIPASKIEARTAGMCYDDADMFTFCMRAMDEAFMSHANKGSAGDAPPGSPVNPRDAFRDATTRQRN